MSKLVSSLAGSAVLAAGLAAIPTVGQAQSTGNISEVVVYGNDPCPRSTDDDVVVCARKPERERYRIPEKLRPNGSRQSREAWASRARSLETVGRTGINSCSPVGPAGFTGCLTEVVREARRERDEGTAADTAPVE
jgi:hypothetical protein